VDANEETPAAELSSGWIRTFTAPQNVIIDGSVLKLYTLTLAFSTPAFYRTYQDFFTV